MPLEITAQHKKTATVGAIDISEKLLSLGKNKPGVTERLFFTEQLSLLL